MRYEELTGLRCFHPPRRRHGEAGEAEGVRFGSKTQQGSEHIAPSDSTRYLNSRHALRQCPERFYAENDKIAFNDLMDFFLLSYQAMLRCLSLRGLE
jgi:hypothetical protein